MHLHRASPKWTTSPNRHAIRHRPLLLHPYIANMVRGD